MTFSELLIADVKENLVEFMKSINKIENIADIFATELEEKLKTYFIIGGMPEVVKTWGENKDIEKVNYIQENILIAYENDFTKHTNESEANKISLIWNSIPSQLSKQNKKFVYGLVKEGARAREYENALNWLNNASLITKVYNVTKPFFPLKAYQDLNAYKIYMNDISLLRRMARLDSKIILETSKLFEEFKGSLTENYILNILNTSHDSSLYYYTFNRNEIDFVIQLKNEIIPIEVKSGDSKKHISLIKYNQKNNNKISLRFSLNNLKQDDKIINIPLYLAEYLDNILN